MKNKTHLGIIGSVGFARVVLQLSKHIKNEMRKMNILVSTDGPYDNVIKMKPPLCFSPQDIDIVLDALESILDHFLFEGSN